MADLPNYFENIPNAAPENSLLNSFLEDYFQHKHFKNTTQRNAIARILKRDSDVIVSLPKGQGRTTCFQLPILICQKKVSIVFVGLSSRVNRQINHLSNENVYIEIIDENTSSEEFDQIKDNIQSLSKIRSTFNSLLFVTPDVVPTVDFLNLLNYLTEQNSLGYIVVDASYCENEWISDQTKEYCALRALRKTYINVPWVVTTSKASHEIVGCIATKLCLRTQRTDIPRNTIPWFAMNIEDEDEVVDR